MAFPVVLEAPVATNPWSHRWGLSPFRITGTVTSRTEDAEGNQFTPDRMNWSQFLREGYLDIDHAYFNNNIEAAIIGVPETVIIWADRVEVTFRLVNRPDTEAIYQYIHDHPNLLSRTWNCGAGTINIPKKAVKNHCAMEIGAKSYFLTSPNRPKCTAPLFRFRIKASYVPGMSAFSSV